MGFQPLEEEGIKIIFAMTINYTEGIQFVLDYYLKGVPSWSWHYEHFYAPLCSDIHFILVSFVLL
jgi:5'-3' exoribonuclease 1